MVALCRPVLRFLIAAGTHKLVNNMFELLRDLGISQGTILFEDDRTPCLPCYTDALIQGKLCQQRDIIPDIPGQLATDTLASPLAENMQPFACMVLPRHILNNPANLNRKLEAHQPGTHSNIGC